MDATPAGDAAPTVTADGLAEMRRTMHDLEPNWPITCGELARHIETVLPLIAGTVQGTAAEHAFYEYTRELDAWHVAADLYFAAYERYATYGHPEQRHESEHPR
jgi:hypothetical protein